MNKIVFIDTETTSLRPDRRAWEVGLIVRKPNAEDRECSFLVDTDDIDLGNADPFALKIGRFYDRHPQAGVMKKEPFGGLVSSEHDVLRAVEFLTRDAHLVGAVPNFDADVLGTRMRAHGIFPSWHYHLIDVEALAVGFLHARVGGLIDLPWNSDWLTNQIGLDPVPDEERHTALGDARWARAIYDRVTGGDRG